MIASLLCKLGIHLFRLDYVRDSDIGITDWTRNWCFNYCRHCGYREPDIG